MIQQIRTEELIIPALILNEPYASKVFEGIKTIETRMRKFSYTGDLVICMGKQNNHWLAGKALCIVHFGEGRLMEDKDADAACIGNAPGRIAYDLNNRRLFSYNFKTSDYSVKKNYQGMFSVRIPDFVTIIPVNQQP
jgi:hypothetical protein